MVRLVTFDAGAGPRTGVLNDDATRVRDASELLPAGAGVLEVVEQWDAVRGRLAELRGREIEVDSVRLLAPIPVPRRNVFCVGKNYAEHSLEFSRSGYDASGEGVDLPTRPIVFTKAPSSVTGPFDVVETHQGLTSELDYEAELGVVIGTGGRGIDRAHAYDHVWGYTIVNDVTARDLQRDHKQWFLGKSLDTFCPCGPAIVTSDEITPADVPGLEVECRVNGELRQKAPVADLIFDVPTLIETISAGITLQPGDIIATGTPAGVGIGFSPPRFLAAGDVVEVTISRLGAIRNEFR
ncbi:MAG: Ureidoglycolate lyase [Actinoallomurus sp.]|nr:Ureidoglycolate lyase [Actinoallomurus sp.]